MPRIGRVVGPEVGLTSHKIDVGAGASQAARAFPLALTLLKRVFIPVNASSEAGLIAASRQDPWKEAGKYGLGWTYFCIILLVFTAAARFFNVWKDKIRTALYKEEQVLSASSSPDTDYELRSLGTPNTSGKFFPRPGEAPKPPKTGSSLSTIRSLNVAIAAARWFLYRPIPSVRWRKRTFTFPSIGAALIVSCAFVFVTLYSFVPQPLYYASLRYGSPPLAIRAGMLAVALVPWIVAMSMKANLVSLITGIGHERLNKFHRWGGYLCLFLCLVHAIPFYVQPAKEKGALEVFKGYFAPGTIIYGTGIACLVPLLWLCIASLPFLRSWMYELFVALHMPVAVLFVAMLFWHCNNYLRSWSYLWATVAIWLSCYVARLFKLNWTYPWRMSWLIGDEAAVTLLAEDAVRVTIPTEVRWKPGQFVYLRIPAISVFENHPFTIASLCSDDFPSVYGERYRDLVLVFKPFGGFTRKVLNKALIKGPMHTYRAFLDGPYGGMQRSLDSFDNVVLIAGGSGITALVSHVLDLVKRMRDGKATTRKVQIIWAVKRLEAMEWFKEELRICREYAPPDSVECLFFVTAAKRQTLLDPGAGHKGHHRPISGIFGSEKINEVAQGIASKRNSALVRDGAVGNVEKMQGIPRDSIDGISALPMRPTSQSLMPPPPSFPATAATAGPIQRPKAAHTKQKSRPSLDLGAVSNFNRPGSAIATTTATNITPTIPSAAGSGMGAAAAAPASVARPPRASFDFGFPSTPTLFQKNLMRFAFGVSGVTRARDGWSMQYGRPDLGYMLKDFARGFGTRSCVFVCGPPGMRSDVARAVAQLQREVLRDPAREEIHLHYEDFAL